MGGVHGDTDVGNHIIKKVNRKLLGAFFKFKESGWIWRWREKRESEKDERRWKGHLNLYR